MDARWIIQVNILCILNSTVTVNWRLPSLNAIVLFIGLTVVARTVTKVPLVVIRVVIVIRKVILGGIVSQAALIVLNVPSLVRNLTLTVLYFLTATVVVIQLNATW